MNIPVVVVDDMAVDRYTARRRFSESDGFGNVLEFSSGDAFLGDYYAGKLPKDEPPLVLMDINMPGHDGFDVIDRIQSISDKQNKDPEMVFMIISSSQNPFDREWAAGRNLIKGYVVKPLDKEDVDHIRATYGAYRRNLRM